MLPALFATLHHLAAFALASTLVTQYVLLRDPLTVATARRLRRVDAAYGMAAGAVIALGLLRVFYFEKGAAYYFHNAAFHAKLTLYGVIGLVSIVPTRAFRAWAPALREGRMPEIADAQLRRIRACVQVELAALALLILCAALMARGVGSFE